MMGARGKADYAEKAKKARRAIIRMLHASNGSFAGSALSCVDLLTVLYHGVLRYSPNDPDRDVFFLSKGHSSSALYATLAAVKLLPKSVLASYGRDGSLLCVHPKKGAYPGIEASSGSLGHGLALATGYALAGRIRGSDARVFVLLGDGECNEGSIWENAAFAARQRLDHLIVIVDRNGLQGCGRDCDILNYGNMAEKFRAFGFQCIDIDGHDYVQIEAAFRFAVSAEGKPTAIIAHTIKGKGVSFMEDRLEWHYKSPNADQFKQAMEELQ